MPIYQWKPEFSVNIQTIDAQHRQLMDTINILHEAMKKGRPENVINETCDHLAEYVGAHFAAEEELFVKYGYPRLAQHKKEHDRFRSKIEDFKKQLQAGKASLSVDLSIFLFDWLHSHVLGMDMDYKPFLNGKGVF